MNTLPEKCPYCGADPEEALAYRFQYKCGVWKKKMAYRVPLCIEREARQKAEAELEKITNKNSKIINVLDDAIADLHCFGYPIAARRYRLSLNTLEGKL